MPVPGVARRDEPQLGRALVHARVQKRGGGVEVAAARRSGKGEGVARGEHRGEAVVPHEPRPRLVEHREARAQTTQARRVNSQRTRYRLGTARNRRGRGVHHQRAGDGFGGFAARRRRERERGDEVGREPQRDVAQTARRSVVFVFVRWFVFVGIRVTAAFRAARAREEHQRARFGEPVAQRARVAQPKDKLRRAQPERVDVLDVDARFATGRSASVLFRVQTGRDAPRSAHEHAPQRLVAKQLRRHERGRAGARTGDAERVFFTFAPPRLEYRRRRRETRERNRLNETDALGDESPYGLAVARIRVVLEHAEVAQRQDHASGRESAVGRRVPTERRARDETVARRRRDGIDIAIRDIFASRATHGVFPAVAPARSRERALLPRERSVREWQDALAGAGASWR